MASAAAAAVVLCGLASCARTPWKRSLLASGPGFAVYAERKFDANDQPVPLGYRHPVNVEPAQLKSVLASLRYTRSGFFSAHSGAVFREDELDKLAEPLARALTEIGPDERLRFLSVKQVGYVFLAADQANSGVVFATDDSELNVAFDLVDEEIALEDGNPESVRFRTEPTDLSRRTFLLHPPAGIASRGTSANWLLFDPAKVKDLPPASVEEETADGPAAASGGAVVAGSDSTPRSTTAPRDAPEAVTAPPPAPSEKDTSDGPRVLFPYKSFRVIQHGESFYGIAASEGPFDAAKFERGEYKTSLRRDSVEAVIEAVNAILESVRQ